METRLGNLYDYPKYYDLVFGSDWKAEYDFLLAAFDRYAARRVRRVFEPACGTGRLLLPLAKAGYRVAGNDLNPKAVAYCNRRLARHGFKSTAVVGDMADFTLRRPVDAAFNTINSFRHLASESQARAHLECMANALAPGGIYLLGLHLTPTRGEAIDEESWAARRGNLAVISHMQTLSVDLKARMETVGMTFDVYTPTQNFRLANEIGFRTYTARQMRALLESDSAFEVAAVYDFAYEIDEPIRVGPETEDVVYVLRRV
ncbi:MAG: class I SAM-dependent methyltransferase [Planctomycetales bacterium]|nr:class I SAM-dependent methyltransferase [Planctomycetales bacterium]